MIASRVEARALALCGASLVLWGCHAIVGIEERGAGGSASSASGGLSTSAVATTSADGMPAPSTGASSGDSVTGGSTGSGSPYAELVRSDGAILHYRFEEANGAVIDAINGNHGSVHTYANKTSSADGPGVTRSIANPRTALGDGYLFHGSADGTSGGYVLAGNSAAVAFEGTAQFSVELWAMVTNRNVELVSHLKYTGNANADVDGYTFGVFRENTTDLASAFRAWGSLAMGASSDVELAVADASLLHHYVLTFDGTSIAIHVDGVQGPCGMYCTPNGATSTSILSVLSIGGGYNGMDDAGTPNVFNGGFADAYIDEVAIYPNALTSDRIRAHFEAAPP